MATNWSIGSGFGGGLGGTTRGQSGGTGSGLGSSVGGGLGNGGQVKDWRELGNPLRGVSWSALGGKQSTGSQDPYKSYTPPRPDLAHDGWQAPIDPNGPYAPQQATYDTATGNWSLPGTIPATQGPGTLSDLLSAQYQSQIEGLAQDSRFLEHRNALDARGLDLRRQGLVSDAGFDRQRLGLRLKDLDIDRGSNALKLAGLGLDRKDNESERGYITRLRELAGQGNTNASNRISFEGQDKARALKSSYITGGTTFSPGHIYDQRANYLRTLSDLESQNIGYNKELAGFDRRDAGLNIADERIGLSEQEVGLANQRLDLMAGQLGIDRAQLEAGLNRGLAQLGLEGQVNALELLSALSQNQGEAASLIAQLASDAIGLGLDPGDLMQGFNNNSLPTFTW